MTGRMGERARAEAKSRLLSENEDACSTDSDVWNFDGALQERIERVIQDLPKGVQVHSLSLESLREVTTCLRDMSQQVVKVIPSYCSDMRSTPELSQLVKQLSQIVKEYFDNSGATLDFNAVLEKYLAKATKDQLIIEIALQRLPAEGKGPSGEEDFRKALEDLRNLRSARSPLPEDFWHHLESLIGRHTDMLNKLCTRQSKLDRKLKRVEVWRKISSIIFVATFATVLICSIVASVMAAPPVAAALGAASAIPIASMGKWVNCLWKKYKDTVKGQKKVVNVMEGKTYVFIAELENVKFLVNRLENTISSELSKVELCPRAVPVVIEDMRKQQHILKEDITDLFEHVRHCSNDILQARTTMQEFIYECPFVEA